jgi:hypothetical protein
MKTSTTILTFTSLLTSALAVPSSTGQTTPVPYCVIGFKEDCSPGGCIYNFDISFPGAPSSNGGEPAFSTRCTGTNVANKLQPCDDPQVLANEVPGSSNFTLQIEHTYNTENGATYHVFGNHTVVLDKPEPYSFEVFPSSAYAVL